MFDGHLRRRKVKGSSENEVLESLRNNTNIARRTENINTDKAHRHGKKI